LWGGRCGRFDDKEVQRDIKLFPYKIINKDGKPNIQVKVKDGEVKVFSPEEISAMVLMKMKETAEAFLGKKIKDAVVTVPGELRMCNRSYYRRHCCHCFIAILWKIGNLFTWICCVESVVVTSDSSIDSFVLGVLYVLFQHTSMMHNGRLPRMLVLSLV
jgi:hypothetical protein